ncbi:uncharacterized protein LOC143251073 [Tachypleus tridentatus]|uniref:uncharacterized protein LOC143251073 n=1 Tax=Tachypleus tridentatus TaxID=6853 RepID=UPI003FD1ADED
MNLCKSTPFSTRAKSLREKFGSKRSYSENLKGSQVPKEELVAERQVSVGCLHVAPPLPSEQFNPYSTLSEDTYCSALDINSHQGDPRFPWQRDAAIQCDISPEGNAPSSARSSRQTTKIFRSDPKGGVKKTECEVKCHSASASFYKNLPKVTSKYISTPSKVDLPHENTDVSSDVIPRHKGCSGLQRSMSLERGKYKSKLVHQTSVDESRFLQPSPYVPHHVQTLTPSLEGVSFTESTPPLARETAENSSAPNSRTATPPHEVPPQPLSDANVSSFAMRKPSGGELRKLRFVRKETHSAPNSLEETTPQTPERNINSYFNLDNIQKFLDLTLSNASSKNNSLDSRFHLGLPSQNARDGKGAGYLNLPSPNLQGVEPETNIVFKKLSSVEDEESETDELEEAPPAAVLHRRRALVPPKMITDGYESTGEDGDHEGSSQDQTTTRSDDSSIGRNRRRSSIVVIPPMQICPGDLLVYSKVLTHRNDFLVDLDGSTQCLAGTEDSSRKGKNTWSLLRLFDRSSRGKSESLCGLEEVLSTLPPCEFVDEQLAKYKGMQWSDFVCQFEDKQAQQRQEQRARSVPSSSTTWSSMSSSVGTPPPLQSDLRPSFGEAGKLLRANSLRSRSGSTHQPKYALSCNHSNQFQLGVANSISENQLMKTSPESSPYRTFLEHQQSSDVTNRSLTKHALSYDITLSNDGSQPSQNLSFDEASSNDTCRPFNYEELREMQIRTKGEMRRREALWDLFQSETMFLYAHLMVLKNVFMEPLKKIQVEGFAMFAQPEVLFGNLDELCCVTYAFCREFIHLILQNMQGLENETTNVLVKLFQKSSKAAALRQAYHRYTLNYINALNYLETLRRQVEFNEFEKWCSRDPRCKKLQLTDLLVSPVQHIMRVPLLLKEIEMRTDDIQEREIITNIIESEETSLRELDDKMKWLKNFERLLEIQRNIIWPSITELDPKAFIPEFLKAPLSKQPCERLIVSPKRQIVLEGPLQLLDSGKPTEMYVVLFDDMLLITRRKKGLHKKKSSITENWASSCSRGSTSQEGGFKYVVHKQPLSLDRFFIHDVSPQDGAANNLKQAFVLVLLNRFQQVVAVHTFQASNESVKATWLSKLKDTIDKWKRTLQNTVFRSNRDNPNNASSSV